MSIDNIKIRTKLTKSLTNAIKKGLTIDNIKSLLNNKVQLQSSAINCKPVTQCNTREKNKADAIN